MFDADQPFCLINRAGITTLTTGQIVESWLLERMPRPTSDIPVVTMVPYAQLRERGFVVHDEHEPLLSLVPTGLQEVDLDTIFPGKTPSCDLNDIQFEHTDEEFSAIVERVIHDEICRGEGSNFLISRKGKAQIDGFSPEVAVVIFRRLVQNEPGAYLTFCFFDGTRYFIGSSPERHVTVKKGRVTMNPICGTLPKTKLRSRDDLISFLTDPKEINELFQVVDEELKMMSKICPEGGTISGPFLKEMSSLIHTEYVLDGYRSGDVISAFRDSMFAATMIGSPLENAARVIHRHESESRRYYSSALLIDGVDDTGCEHLDSAITIRTMEVSSSGTVLLQSGASVVRDSDPMQETEEIKAKVAGLLRSMASAEPVRAVLTQYYDEDIERILQSRNADLSKFWMDRQPAALTELPTVARRRILIIDNEDEFTFMMGHLLAHLGLDPVIRKYSDPQLFDGSFDLVLVGPGPGDPTNLDDPKMRKLGLIVDELLATQQTFMAVCLGHQILSTRLGLGIKPVDPPLQGVQEEIMLFDRSEKVGFYNTFLAQPSENLRSDVSLALDDGGNVIALRGPHFHSFQFHVESVLTRNSEEIMRRTLEALVGTSSPQRSRTDS